VMNPKYSKGARKHMHQFVNNESGDERRQQMQWQHDKK